MVTQRSHIFKENTPKIFALPVFEVLQHENIPNNKTTLEMMVKEKRAFYFHINLCFVCHAVPNATEWLNKQESDSLNVFVTIKRHGKQRKWEAFYIGTQDDPLFDERLTWEGQSNKMTQAFIMCLLDYDYMVLDNAFLTHKPGIKKKRVLDRMYLGKISETNKILKKYIGPELRQIYGENIKCRL